MLKNSKGPLWKLFGIIQIASVYLIGIAAFAMMVEPIKSGSATWVHIVGYVGLGLILSPLYNSGRKCYLKGKKIVAVNRRVPFAEDSRRPVAYLRSFTDDTAAAEPYGDGPSGTEFNYLSFKTEEEQLKAVMCEIGPFKALGRPGEKLPELGADRIYSQHERWQKEVIELISAAQLVVIRLGATPGVLEEMSIAVNLVKPERLLLLVPYKISYKAFRKQYAKVFPAGLPEDLGSGWFQGIDRIHGVIYFESDWTPHFVRLKLSRLYSGTTPLKASLKIALTPVVKRLDLHFKPLMVPWSVKSPFIIIFLLFVLIQLLSG